MPTRRVPLYRDRRAAIKLEAIEAWRVIRKIEAEGGDREWEPEGRRQEYLDACNALHTALRLNPWERSPARVTRPEPPARVHDLHARGWQRAWELRQMLEEALEVAAA